MPALLRKLTEAQIRSLRPGVHRMHCVRLHPGRLDWEVVYSGEARVHVDHYVSRVSRKVSRPMLSIFTSSEDAEYSVCREKPEGFVPDDEVREDGDLVFEDYMTRLYADWGEGFLLSQGG